jgi:uncharacterized repeat protein (TIGR01451 family)
MSKRSLFVQLLAAMILLVGTLAPRAGAQSAAPDRATRERIDSAYGKLPLQFEANQGQQPAQVKFLSRGKDCTVFLTPDGVTLSLRKLKSQARIDKPGAPATERVLEASADLRLNLEGGNSAVKLTGADPLPGAVNYIIGKDPAKWRTNVATYAKVRYEQVYPGIDLVFYGNQRQLEYDFVLAPGANPDAIRLAVEGADRTSVDDATGDLVLAAAGQEIRFHKPTVYEPETGDEARQEVEGSFHVNKNHVTFEVAAYDHARALVVDPVLAYSTFLGGSSFDYALAVTTDKQGNAYIGGLTCSTNFPTTAGSYSPAPPVKGPDPQCNFGIDQSGESAFITKLNAAGSALVFSTYLGGSYADRVLGIAVDSSDNVYVGGFTNSFNFPVTAGAFQTVCGPVAVVYPSCPNTVIVSSCQGGSPDSYSESGFVTKLNPTGSALIYSTFIGGSGNDGVQALAVNSSGEVYVAANSASSPMNETLCSNNPPTAFAWPTTSNGYEGWVPGLPSGDEAHPAFAVFSADGSSLVYSTLYGPTTSSPGGNNTGVTSMAVDSAGKAYIGGYTNYATFPVTPGAYQTTCPGCAQENARADGFVTVFNPAESGTASLVYSTFLGGNGTNSGGYCSVQPGDVIYGIAVDTNSNAYVTGATCSSDFPTTHGAFQATDPTPSNCTDPTTNAFLSKLNSTGAKLDYSTFLGGSTCNRNSVGYAVAVDSADDAFVTGNTFDDAFPTMNPLFPSFSGSGNAVFVSELNTKGSALLFSTLLGAGGGALGYAIHADNYGNVYVAGQASGSSYLPTTTGAFQTTFGGGATDAFALRIALTQADLSVTNSAPSTVLREADLTYTITVTNNGPNTAHAITLTDSVPKGTTFVKATMSSGSCKTPAVGAASGKVTCAAASLADGAAMTVSMTVKVTAKSGKTLTDTATVSSLVYDASTTNNSATATTTVN